jgi:PAS domain S-box-containing protein
MSEPLNILIVEDRPDDAELAVAALRRDGFAPQWRIVATRADYLAYLSPDLDLILADYTLPAFDAPTALRLLDESGLDVPLIVISGTVGEEQAVALMRQGAADYLLKDRLTRLGEAARRALNERMLRQEARRAEAALMASEDRFRRLTENAPDIIYRWRVTGPMGFEYISPAVETILGYPVEKFYENPRFPLTIAHPDDRDVMGRLLTGEQPFEPVTVRVRHKDGTTVWLERRSAPVRTTEGNIIASEGIIRDVTERKQMEQALRDSQARLQAIFDNAQDAILLTDDDRRYVDANPAACNMLGYEREELLTMSVEDVTADDSREAVPDMWAAFVEAETLGGEYTLQRKDGGTVVTDFRAVANIEPGVHLAVMRDITERKLADEALRRSEGRFRQLFEAAPIPLLMIGAADGVVLAANQRLVDAVELPVDDIVGRAITSLEDFAGTDLPLDRMARESVQDRELHIHADASGAEVWLLLSSEPITLEEGPAVLVSFQSITPLKEAQRAEHAQREFAEALSANALDIHRTLSLEETLNRLLDNVRSVMALDAASILLVDEGRLRYGAQVGYDQMNMDPDLLADHPVENLVTFRQALESGEPVWAANAEEFGQWRDIPGLEWIRSFVIAPILLDGRAVGVLSVASREVGAFSEEDAARLRAFSAQAATAIVNARLYEELEEYSEILEQAVRKRTAELEEARDQAESILNHSPDPILLLEPDGAIRVGNPAFERLFGYEVDELQGQPITTLVAPEQRETLAQLLRAIAHRPEPARREMTAVDAAGSLFDTHLSLSRIGGGNGAASGVVCGFHDISALKEVQRMKDQFVSTATHELRTPLTSIKGFSELLLTRELTEERQRRYINLILEQSTHLALLIDDMLDLSKLTAGKGLEIQPEPVDMEPLIREVLDTFRDVSPGHTFRVEGCEGLPPVPGDSFRLNQVLRNLLSNAVKYSPAGGTVTVSCQVLDGHLLLSVADEGIGITEEQQSHLFEEFYRADHAVKGTGLGLRISQLIVQGHGGWIWAESQYGAGSTFHFTLPLEQEKRGIG